MPGPRASDRTSIVVVGAGITGAFAAYFLSERNVDVTLVDRGFVGRQASSKNSGGLNPLHGPGIPEPMLDLSLAAFRLHLAASERIHLLAGGGSDIEPVDRVHLAMSEKDIGFLATQAALHDATRGFDAHDLSAEAVRSLVPSVAPGVLGGLLTSGSMRVDPDRYARRVALAALRSGTHLVRGQVDGIRHKGNRVTGVELGDRTLECTGVVVALGAWFEQAIGWLGTHLPIFPVKGELLLVEQGDTFPEVDITRGPFGVYRAGGGRAWLGGTEENVGFDDRPSEHGKAAVLAGIHQLLPGLGPLRVIRHVAGLRPTTPDGLPIVGLLEPFENVVVAGGAGRKGMLLGSALGHAAADLVTTGTTSLPIEPCRPDRPGVVT